MISHDQPQKSYLNDFMQNVKLFSDESNKDLTPLMPSNSRHHHNHAKSLSNKRMSFNENSIDADDIDMAVSLAFPQDLDNMKDDIWRRTLSSDCDRLEVWEKQPEANKTPSIVWPSTSTRHHYYGGDDIWSNLSSGTNIFFPSTPASTSVKQLPVDSKNAQQKLGNRKKSGSSKLLMTPSASSIEIDEDFNNHIKKRLSLSALRNSLCRQKGLENLNNGQVAQARASGARGTDDEFLQVLFFHDFKFVSEFKLVYTTSS